MKSLRVTTVEETNFLIKHAAISLDVFYTAIECNIFEFLKANFISLEEIQKKHHFNVKKHNLLDFFDKLFHLGLLERKGQGLSSEYKNSDSTNLLFIKDSNKNILQTIKIYREIQENMKQFGDILKGKEFENNKFKEILNSPVGLREYLYSMEQFSKDSFELLAKNLEQKHPIMNKLDIWMDIGGGLGVLSNEIYKVFPQKKIITFDLPVMEPLVRNYLDNLPNKPSINVVSGDFLKDPFPKADCMILSNVLLDFDPEERSFLLKKIKESLLDDGILLVIQPFIENKRYVPCIGLDISIAMKAYYGKGGCCTEDELKEIAKKHGFKEVEYFVNEDGLEYCLVY